MNKISDTSPELLARIAWEYYINNVTQSDLALRYEMSRPTISRLLQRARDEGIVQIAIRPDADMYLVLEQVLRNRYAIPYVRIIPSAGDSEALLEGLGQAASLYLNRIIGQHSCLAVGWGRTISHIARFARPEAPITDREDHMIVEMVGNFGSLSAPRHEGLRLAIDLASVYGFKAHVISAPAVATNPGSARALKNHPQIADVLALAASADFAIASLGTADASSTMHQLGLLSDAELATLRQAGGVGEVLGRFFDQHGQPVHTELDQRLIGLTIEQLRTIPNRMIVAGGSHKIPALRGALNGSLMTHLITDEQTAHGLLDGETIPTRQGGILK